MNEPSTDEPPGSGRRNDPAEPDMPVEDSPVYAEAATHLDVRSRH